MWRAVVIRRRKGTDGDNGERGSARAAISNVQASAWALRFFGGESVSV